jgi:hypothetical protein
MDSDKAWKETALLTSSLAVLEVLTGLLARIRSRLFVCAKEKRQTAA